MKRTMIRKKSMFESLPDDVEPRLPDIDNKPLDLNEIKKKCYPEY